MKTSMLPILVLLPVALLGTRCPMTQDVTDIGQTRFYGQTAWASTHRDSRNSDFSPFVAPARNVTKWTALDGAATLLAPAIGPEGNLYVTTGRGPGTSHLHAFDRDGNLLWESEPQSSLDDLDSSAVGSSPLVDRSGFVYVSDANQFWSFEPDGDVRWVAPLPPPSDASSAGAPLLSSILTNQGFVGGINRDGKVVLFDRFDGELAMPIFELPQGEPQPPGAPRGGLWQGGLVDPAIIPFVEAGFFGAGAQVTNTPAVDPATGRIWITAAGPIDAATGAFTGRLYGLDIVDGAIEIGAVGTMGGGSGTSPAISTDGTQVYAADGNGVMNAFDASTGATLWTASGAAGAASPGVGPDGTVYSGDSGSADTLVALAPADGSVLWEGNYDALAAATLPPLPPAPPLFPTGQPLARFNSVVSISAKKVWVALVLGYQFFNPTTGEATTQPRATVIAAVDSADGTLLGSTLLRDTQEGLISIGSDGSVYASQGALLSSVFFFGVNPLLQSLNLPSIYLVDGPPAAGISALEPASFLDHVVESLEHVRSLAADARAELPGGDIEAAFTATRRGRTQLRATAASILDAEARGEIDAAMADTAHARVLEAEGALTVARGFLGRPSPGPVAQELAELEISVASELLVEALGAVGAVGH